jgi:choline dehydrogenase
MSEAQFDYIVVGGGSAGCVMAARLSEDGKDNVLLLEAGGSDDHPYIQMPMGFLKAMVAPRFNWNYWTEEEPHLNGRRMPMPRGKLLGGSGSINGMFAMRGHPADYDQWAQLGARGWSYAECLPYFRKLENSWRGASKYHGDQGPVRVRPIDSPYLLHEEMMASAVNAGFATSDDLTGDTAEGFARGEQTVDDRGRRVSAASAYLKPALGRKNLDVRQHTQVTRVVFDGKRAIGVEVHTPTGSQLVRARKEVVLSGGTYNSAQLLLLSGVGPAAHLKDFGITVVHNSPGVGRNLQEHPTGSLEFEAKERVTFLKHMRMDRLAFNALRWALTGKGTLSQQLNSCNVVVRTADHLDRPDLQVMVNPIRFDAQPWFPWFKPEQEHVFWAGVVQLHPESRGWVELKSTNPLEEAAITFNLMAEEADLEQMRRAIRVTRRIYGSEPMASLVGAERAPSAGAESDDELNDLIRATCYTAQHPVGTCAMAMGERSVVDEQCRVLGVEGLRVVDCSVMPTVPGGNTNVPVIMLAEKAADMMRGKQLPPADLAA